MVKDSPRILGSESLKNISMIFSARNLIIGWMVGSTSKSIQKWVTEHKMKIPPWSNNISVNILNNRPKG